MAYTNFPNGVTSFGVPLPSQSNMLSAMWSTSYFVDVTYGLDGNDGVSPDSPLATVTRAIAVAQTATAQKTLGSVIFVRDRKWTANTSDPLNYSESGMVVPLALQGLHLLGTGPNQQNPWSVQIKGGSTAAILTVRAPNVVIENLDFNRGSSTAGHIVFKSDGTVGTITEMASGVAVVNCHLRNSNQSTTGAITIDGVWFANVEGCYFTNCRVGVLSKTSADTCLAHVIRGNHFDVSTTDSGANIDAHYAFSGGPAYSMAFIGNDMVGPLPAVSGGTYLRFISLTGINRGLVAGNTFPQVGALLTFGATGSGGKVPVNVGFVNNWQERTASADADSQPIFRT